MKIELDVSSPAFDGIFEALIRYHAELAINMARNSQLMLAGRPDKLHHWEDIAAALKTLDACNEILRYIGAEEMSMEDTQ